MSFLNPSNLLNQFGIPNYIQNGNFEMYDAFAAQVAGATKWNAYKDAAQPTPVDGTGGTATVIRNASVGSGSQLRGTRSWQITKTGNAQGEGYSQDFTIDPADKSQTISISFDFNSGSAYTTGDLAVYIYDVTNSTLITPSVVNIPSGAGLFKSTFTTTTSTSYRIIFHCAASNATTTNWSMTIDTIQVIRNESSAATTITNWQSYTPTISGFGTVTNNVAHYRRVGDTIFVSGSFTSGTSTATLAGVSLPSSLSFDSTKSPTDQTRNLGIVMRFTSVTTAFPVDTRGPWVVTSSTGAGAVNTNAYFSVSVDTTGAFKIANGSGMAASGDIISYEFSGPISGWSS